MAKGKEFKRPPNKRSKRIQIREIEPPINYELKSPIFSFKHMQYRGPCCISTRQGDEKSLIIEKLLRLSQLTWAEIKKLPRENGFEKLPHFRFRVGLPKVLTPEVTILVTRYDNDGGRLAGFRINDIYHIVLAGKNLYSH